MFTISHLQIGLIVAVTVVIVSVTLIVYKYLKRKSKKSDN